MEDVETPETTPQSSSAGRTLLKAREDAGLTRADIASRTKVAERHIAAIEEDRFEDMAARTYAVGFSRAYARAVGLDEKHIAEMVRTQLDAHEPLIPTPQPTFEPGDPARVPSSGLAWMAGGAIALVLGLVVYFWGNVFFPEGQLPSLITEDEPAQVASPAPRPAQSAVAVASDAPVVLTSNADQLWLRVSDGEGKTLLQTVLARGQSWTVPADAKAPQLRTARADVLSISVGGKTIAPLSQKPGTVSGVSLKPADLLGQPQAGKAPVATAGVPSASASATARAAGSSGTTAPRSSAPRQPQATGSTPAAAARAQTAAPAPAPAFTSNPVIQSTQRGTPSGASGNATGSAPATAVDGAVSTTSD